MAEKVLAILKGGHKKFWGSFYTVAWSFSHMVGGREKFPLFRRVGREKFYPVLRGGGTKSFGPAIFPIFVTPPPRN